MIYDLKTLQDRNYRATDCGSPSSDFEVVRSDILLAIAERLGALVELDTHRNELHAETVAMQKQMLERKSVSEVKEDTAYIEAINNLANSLKASPEVLAKLRGDV